MTLVADKPARTSGALPMVLDSAGIAGIEVLRALVDEARRSGCGCVVQIEEAQIDLFATELALDPLVDLVVKPVSERSLAMRVSRLAGTARALQENASVLQQARSELDRLAYYDRMTNLPNYEFFQRHMAFQIRHAERYGRQLAVLAVDLHSLGRLKGLVDPTGVRTLLGETSRRMVAELRSHDVVGQAPHTIPLPDERNLTRLDGDRFLVLLSEFRHIKDVTGIVSRLLAAVSAPVEVAGTVIQPSPRVGISLFPADGSTEDQLIRNAVSALEFSSDHRLGQLGFFAESMNREIADRILLESSLRRATEAGSFKLLFQPKVSLVSERMTGLEALLRWEDAQLGEVSPVKFIPLAEELGLICDITRWVVAEVCRQIRSWQEAGVNPPPVAVNLSGQDFLRPDFATYVTEQLLVHEVPPRSLEFEITESAVISDIETSTRVLESLRHIGVKVSLDDFGTGYSSLSYLQRMPVDTVKIDRSFISNVTSDWNSAAITSGIITLSHILSLNVVAEGVESDDQIQLLKDQNCNEVQGAYYSMPMSADEAAGWM